ncbi:mitochondrial dynamin GTPase Msp1 [Coemansia sp. RSA 486]|nr:mitochondrial dynamin GTPase Msp1 [Coemansia sp. RSA 486]
MLKDVDFEPSWSLDELVDMTAGMSGSDLKEMCRNAAIKPLREYIRTNPVELQRSKDRPSSAEDDIERQRLRDSIKLRPLSIDDFETPSKTHAQMLAQAYNLNDELFTLRAEALD